MVYGTISWSFLTKSSEYETKIKEMSEEEYDNLDEEERKRIDLLRLQKRYVITFIIIQMYDLLLRNNKNAMTEINYVILDEHYVTKGKRSKKNYWLLKNQLMQSLLMTKRKRKKEKLQRNQVLVDQVCLDPVRTGLIQFVPV